MRNHCISDKKIFAVNTIFKCLLYAPQKVITSAIYKGNFLEKEGKKKEEEQQLWVRLDELLNPSFTL